MAFYAILCELSITWILFIYLFIFYFIFFVLLNIIKLTNNNNIKFPYPIVSVYSFFSLTNSYHSFFHF